MTPDQLGPIVGMVFILVVGLVIITYYYFRSKERQLIIEKGLSAEQIAELIKNKKNPYIVLKLGLIVLFFGIGLGLGLLLEDSGYSGAWIPFLIFAFTGTGFIAAFFVSRKFEKEDAK